MNPIDALREVEKRLEDELMRDARYVALMGVRRAINDTARLRGAEDATADTPKPVGRVRHRPPVQAAAPNTGGPSQAEAAFAVLSASTPLPIGELLTRVRLAGTVVGGSNPELNLSSVLSRDDRFGSMRYQGRPCWTIKGKPIVSHTPVEPTTAADHNALMGLTESDNADSVNVNN